MTTYLQELLTTPTLLVFTISLIIAYGVKTWLSQPSGLPPMPCLPIPWLGHTLLMLPSLPKTLMTWAERMGDIFTIYHGSRRYVIIGSYNLLHEALVKKAEIFSDREKAARKLPSNDRTSGIIMNSGPSWREQRSVATTILKDFGMGRNSLAEKIAEEVEAYIKELSGFKEQAQNIRLLTNTAVSNVICSILLGKRFEFNDPFLVRFLKINTDTIRLLGKSSALRMFPILSYIPGDLFGVRELDRISLEMTEMFSDRFIQKFKKELDDRSEDNYIKAYLREMNKRVNAGDPTYLDETNLRRHIDDLFLAGSETSSSTILWAYVYATNFPHIQEKIYREIEEVVGTERLPTLHDKNKLSFLNAFLLELQRHSTIAPLGAPRVCVATTQLGGYTIPKGTNITTNLRAALRDPKTWTDPEVFRPERFLDAHNNVVIPKEFIPFSIGKRACLGEPLAKMEIFLFLSGILQNFEILPQDPSSPPSMDPAFGLTVTPKPFQVRFRQRTRIE